MSIELRHKQEFISVLSDYQPNPAALDVLRESNTAILVGPTSSGRNTIITRLLETGKYHYIISDTTRPKRQNDGAWEEDGVQYWFRTEEEILQDLKEGKFLEAAVIHEQQVSGISIRELQKAYDDNKIAINEIEIAGAESVRRLMPQARLIFILPPAFDVWLSRLLARGTMSNDEVRKRLTSALKELEHIKKGYYTVVINDDLQEAVARVRGVLEDNRSLPYEGSKAEQVAESLKEGIRQYLETH